MTKDQIFKIIKNITLEIMPELDENTVVIDGNLKNLGANSIDRMEIVTMSMEALELKIPLVEFGSIKNIRDLVAFFHSKLGN